MTTTIRAGISGPSTGRARGHVGAPGEAGGAGVKARHGQAALVIGSERPAMSISFDKAGAVDFFVVFFADLFPGDPGFDDLPEQLVCFQCLLEEGDAQLARGLDLARLHGQVDYDPGEEEWLLPEDAEGEA
jgi:hypothetical protein